MFALRSASRPLLDPLAALRDRDYRAWIAKYDTLSEGDRAAIRRHIDRFQRRPLISLLMVIDDPAAASWQASLDSFRRQLYPHWEVCIIDNGPIGADGAGTLRTIADSDARIRIIRRSEAGGEADAGNDAIALARGAFIAFLEDADRLAEHALYEIVAELDRDSEADVVYTDEDVIATGGRRSRPRFKPDWDPDLALGQDLLGRLCVLCRSVVTGIGGLRREFEPAARRDLHLRMADAVGPARIRHVPSVLYHRAAARDVASPLDAPSADYVEAAREAVWRHCRARAFDVVGVEPIPMRPAWNRVVRAIPDPPPLVSLIIPTRDRAELLRACVRGVLDRTNYRSIEVIIADNDSVEKRTAGLFDELSRDSRVRIVKSPGPFNFSTISNAGVAAARGEIIVLLNNDVEVIGPDWLGEMVSHAARPEIGVVGARLLYPDGRVQHAGIVLSPEPGANHSLRLADGRDPGYLGQLALTRSCLAVTGACLAMRRQLFLEIGGLNERELSVTFNDVDLCLRLNALGYRVVCTPFAELMHRESHSRGADKRGAKKLRARAELDYTAATAAAMFAEDKYCNPNLSYTWDRGVVLTPPRRQKSWVRN